MNHTTTKTVRVIVTLAASISLVACGGSDDDGGSPQDEVADLIIESAEEAGADVDRDCIRDGVQAMSDDDAEKIVESGFGRGSEPPDITTEASELLAEVLLCEN